MESSLIAAEVIVAAAGQYDAARELLVPIHDWFTEGFDTTDLLKAQALRDELGSLADEDFRDQIMRQSVEATVEGLVEDATGVASALGAEVEAAMALDAALSQGYANELARLEHDLMGGEFTSLARHKTWTDAAAELAGIVTRRAGVAAAATAEAWERTAGGARLLELGGAGLRRHGGEAPFDAVEVIEQWELKARTDAVERARISVGARRVIARWLWRAVLDPALDTPAAVRRRLREVDDVVAQARGGLVGAFDHALSADAARFSELLAAVPPVSRVSQLEAAIDDVRGALAPNPGIAIDVRETADV